MNISSGRLDQALFALNYQLALRHASVQLVVIGGSGLIAIDVVSRATRDVDVVALERDGKLVSAEPLPSTVRDAAATVARDLGLELLGHRRFDEMAPAMRAGVGQRDFVVLADLLGRRRRSMSVLAVLGTGLTAGPLGLGLGWPFAEGSRLAFTGGQGLFQASALLGNLSLEFGDLLLQK